MRFLLIAYDFPPIPSPQALRWAYLVRELALAGHEVHVLAPDVPGYGAGGLPELPASVRIHRAWPGPFMALLARRQRQAQARQAVYDAEAAARRAAAQAAPEQGGSAPETVETAPLVPAQVLNWKGRTREFLLSLPRRCIGLPRSLARRLLGSSSWLGRRIDRLRLRVWGSGLNWKGQAAESIKRGLSLLMFPDARAEWMPWARKLLDRLLDDIKPDVVITSHEPANSIELGLHAKRRGFRWIADLGDPVLAPYTPPRWRKRAHALERALCERADVVTVTSEAARRVLRERHAIPDERCILVTQGFDHRFEDGGSDDGEIGFDRDRVELLYTGSFYAFRRPGDLLQAVIDTPGVRLSIATIVAPQEVAEAAAAHPDKVRLLGFLAHRQALALQRRCDVLVNLANDDPVQVPGKLYEYIGSGTPILHVGGTDCDASTRLLHEAGAGWCEPADRIALTGRLRMLVETKRQHGRVEREAVDYDLNRHSWQSLAHRVAELVLAREVRG